MELMTSQSLTGAKFKYNSGKEYVQVIQFYRPYGFPNAE